MMDTTTKARMMQYAKALKEAQARISELEAHQKRWEKPVFVLSVGGERYNLEFLDIGHADGVFLLGCEEIEADCRVLGECVKAHREFDSIQSGGEACEVIVRVPPHDPLHPVSMAVTDYGVCQLKTIETDEAVDARPFARKWVYPK